MDPSTRIPYRRSPKKDPEFTETPVRALVPAKSRHPAPPGAAPERGGRAAQPLEGRLSYIFGYGLDIGFCRANVS